MLEIPPHIAEPGGHPAVGAMMEIKRAVDAGGGDLRQVHLANAQQHIAALDPRRHHDLVQHLQGHVLALGGRGGDTRIAHVTPGEFIIPEHMLTRDVLADLYRAAQAQGIDPATLQVGSGRNSINPRTGQMEFSPFLGALLNRVLDPTSSAPSPSLVPPTAANPDLGPGVPIPPGVSLSDNMNTAANFPHWLSNQWYDPGNLLNFANQVRPGGDWDYKTRGGQYENFGNANYQATGAAAGIPDSVLRPVAGAVQMIQAARGKGPWDPSYGVPFDGGDNGDEPKDQTMMDMMNYYLLTGRDRTQ
jgi:hypothetical protein